MNATCSAIIDGTERGCGKTGSARRMRTLVSCWPLSDSGRGTLTNPRLVSRSSLKLCEPCFARLAFGMGESVDGESVQEGMLGL